MTTNVTTIAKVSGLQSALDAKLASSSYTAADVLTKMLTVDGAASGLDADLLDGQHASAFATASHTHAISDVTNLQTSLDAKAPLASPTFTGTPAAPTATGGTNTTQIATTAFVTSAVSGKLDSSSYTASDVLTKLLTVDGASSGIDADLLDGQHGSYYALASAVGTMAARALTISTSDPSGGSNGDVWFKV